MISSHSRLAKKVGHGVVGGLSALELVDAVDVFSRFPVNQSVKKGRPQRGALRVGLAVSQSVRSGLPGYALTKSNCSN